MSLRGKKRNLLLSLSRPFRLCGDALEESGKMKIREGKFLPTRTKKQLHFVERAAVAVREAGSKTRL